MDINDVEACYRAVKSRDRRFDGVFYIAVRTTGIYCRPSCPAQTPHLKNVTFHRTAAAAQAAGYRACKRCLPDATPGSPEWDLSADVAGRAMRLISDGVVERDGVEGLAARIGYSSRHLTRLLTTEVGAGPLALARAKRAQTARTLIETSTMSFADVAFASGFASVRQFNDTIREVYAASPTDLRGRSRVSRSSPSKLELRLAVRAPFNAQELLEFLRLRVVQGVEVAGPDWYARSLRLPHGHGVVRLDFGSLSGRDGSTEFVGCTLQLADLRALGSAVERCRRLIDADCDPVAVDEELGADPVLAPLVRRRPGLRVPGHVDGDELAVRAVLGQQVTVKAARTAAGILTARHGDEVATGVEGVTHLFPTAVALAGVDPEELPMPRARGRALTQLCQALADGELALDRSADRAEVRTALLAQPGIGPWTAGYVAMRALGDPDVFLPTDVGVRHALERIGEVDPESWRPWRSYALLHLWTSLSTRME
ncbi:MAG TPA: AlkA N-terminal domain-containing protein [Nocardioidaceae bacterium]|nr:AlkA N-terminal domain-containing protein [Nocardioidaceae bacterium]